MKSSLTNKVVQQTAEIERFTLYQSLKTVCSFSHQKEEELVQNCISSPKITHSFMLCATGTKKTSEFLKGESPLQLRVKITFFWCLLILLIVALISNFWHQWPFPVPIALLSCSHLNTGWQLFIVQTHLNFFFFGNHSSMYHKAIDNNSKATDSPDMKQSSVLKVMWETRNKSRINVRGGNCCLWRLSVDITAEAKEQKDLQNHVNLYICSHQPLCYVYLFNVSI